MKTKLYILSFVLLLLTVACTTVEQDMPSSKADMTFVAEWADTQTKTAFQADETSIWWSPADEICIYYGASEGNKFTSTNDAEVPKAEFRGTLNAFTGESEAGVAYYFWAVYPYESAVSCDGESVVATLADEQMAKAGSFAPNTNIAIAKSTGLNLSFYNACSWFRFSVTKEGVKRVIFRGNNDEDVTGKFRVSMGEDNRPTAPEVIEGKKEITLHLPDYEPFEVGKIYYITLFPQVFTKGFTVTFKTDTEIATRSISAKATFLRSKYNSGIGFDSPEKGVVYTEAVKSVAAEGGKVELDFLSDTPCEAVIPDDAKSWISVVPETKAIEKQTITLDLQANTGPERSATIKVCPVGNSETVVFEYTVTQGPGESWASGTIPPDNEIWYTTSDNTELDLEGASSYNSKPFDVNVLSHTYSNGKGIVVCDGPIKRINDHVFCYSFSYGSKYITNIFLPNSVEELGTGALQNIGVRELRLPDNLRYVDSYALNNPTLERFTGKNTSADGRCVIIKDGLMPYFGSTKIPIKNYLAAFAPSGLREYTVPEEAEILGFYAFAWCPELKIIHFSEGLKSIYADCFMGDSLDCDIILPSSLEDLIAPFHDCNGIKGFYGNEKFHSSDNHCLIQDNTTITKFVGDDVINYTIPEGITDIVSYAFDNLPNLESVTFSNSLNWVGPDAFRNCPKLTALYGEKASPDHRGFINGTEYVSFLIRSGVTNYTVPAGIKSFGWASFSNSPDLETMTLTDEVVELGGYDFAWCQNLKKVVLSSLLTNVRGQNPFLGSSNLEEIYFRSYLPPAYSDTRFYESDCTHLTVYVPEETLELYKQSGWYQYAPYMVGYEYDDIGEWNPDYYLSTDYSTDGTTTALQHSSAGTGIDLIFMGDAFSDRQIADGTYANVMQKAADAFFSEEPYKSMKDRFNVYTVNVVSATEGYAHSGQALSTGHGDGTYVYGNDAKVIEYAKSAIGEERMDDAVIIVMMNEDAYAGTCFMYYPDSGDYGRGLSIAYFPTSSDADTFNGLVSHEAGGHGFAKLADEYAYEYMGAVTSDAINSTKTMEPYGWWKNVDFTSDPSQVKWSQFIADERYVSENIGCYEGGLTYWTGVWRPTDASIMRYNTGGFNAPSRYAIWYRIGKLAYGESWEGSYEDFVAYDQVNRTPAAAARRKVQRRNYVTKPLPQLPPPVVIGHSWRDEK